MAGTELALTDHMDVVECTTITSEPTPSPLATTNVTRYGTSLGTPSSLVSSPSSQTDSTSTNCRNSLRTSASRT